MKTSKRINPKAKNLAYALYENFVKYHKKVLKEDQDRKILILISEVYLSVYLESREDFLKTFFTLKNKISELEETSETLLSYFEDTTKDNPLKTINGIVVHILNGQNVSESNLLEAFEKMLIDECVLKKKTKTFVSLADGVKEAYIKESKGLPFKTIEYDQKRMNMWVNELLETGLENTMNNETWGDHELNKSAELKGKRSVRISYAGRVIYKVEQVLDSEYLINKVTIVKITSCHDYGDIKSAA